MYTLMAGRAAHTPSSVTHLLMIRIRCPCGARQVGPKLVSSAIWLNRPFIHECFPEFKVGMA